MEFDKLVEIRRSVRSYQAGREIPREDLEAIIKAAQQGPTWKNSQTGRFYVVASPEKMAQVRENCLPSFNQKSSGNASALIVTTFETKVAGHTKGEADNELGDKWGAYDLGLTNAYMILKASDLGLDTLIMGIRDAAKLREELEIPESQDVVAVIAVGYRDGEPLIRPRKSMEEVAKFF